MVTVNNPVLWADVSDLQRVYGCVSRSVVLTLTPWTVAHQASLCPRDFPGKNAGVGSHSLLQGIFLTQELNLGLLHCRQSLYHLSHQGANEYLVDRGYMLIISSRLLSLRWWRN